MNEPTESEPKRAFTKEEEERKRDAYLMKHPQLRMKIIEGAITFAEKHLPERLQRNRPRRPHQKFH
ncbi:MAG: hypothetical protein WCT04_12390 [Planctomycetota bacterium]